MDISLEVTGNGPDAVGLKITPAQARDLAYQLEAGATQYEKTDDDKFHIVFVCSFISCTQRYG